MHTLPASLGIALAVALAATPATAGTLTSATWTTTITGYSGTSTVAVPVVATGSSTSSALSVSLTLPDFLHTSVHPSGPPISFPFATYRKFDLGGAQSIVATAGMASADAPIEGLVLVRLVEHIGGGANASMTRPRTTLFGFPLVVGVSGVFAGYFYPLTSFHYVTVDFYGWTAKAQTFTGLTLKGVALPSVKASGSFGLTAHGGGNVTLVAPARITIDAGGDILIGQQRSVSVSTLKLTFVPEPGVALLLTAAGLACLLMSRKREAP